MGIHTSEVIKVGRKGASSADAHVAIYGGAAVAPVPLPAAFRLFASALSGLAGFSAFSRGQNRKVA